MNFALTHDDGVDLDYADADLILVAVSRAGKTPTCVYLALHYGIRAANYPLTEEDLEHDRLPPRLRRIAQQAVRADHRPDPPAADPPGAHARIRATRSWKPASGKWRRPR